MREIISYLKSSPVIKEKALRQRLNILDEQELAESFGFVNAWWIFGEIAKKLNYKIFMAEVENVGYKRTKRGKKPMPNQLYRANIENGKEKILVDDGVVETALDHLRKIDWS